MSDSSAELARLLDEQLSQRQQAGLLRQRRAGLPITSTHVDIDGRRYVNFASNNYLGLTHHPRVTGAAALGIKEAGAGSGAAPLISGYTVHHAGAERAIALWKGTEAALLLPSGYQANLAAIQSLAAASQSVRFLIDKLAHASLIDAVRASDRAFRVFPHNHLGKLKRLLDDAPKGQLQVVVTESIFSMDGDACDLEGLAELKRNRPFALLLDEAHASGVYGKDGAGYASERGLQSIVDVSVVTLSKALGCAGGAVCGSKLFCDAVINFGRAYMFSTSVPPMVASAPLAAVEVLRDEPQRQKRVRDLAIRVREGLKSKGRELPAGDSPIIPIILGTEDAAMSAAARLRDAHLLVAAVRPPTVPRGSSRLRVTLSCDHKDAEVEKLLAELSKL